MANILVIPPNDLTRHPIPNRLYHIVRQLSRHHNIYLLSYTGHPLAAQNRLRTLKAVEIEISPIKARNLALYYVLNTPTMANAIRKALKEVDLVIHANIIPSYIAAKLAKRAEVPQIYDYMDHYPHSGAYYFTSPILRGLATTTITALVREALTKSDAVVTVSHTFKKMLSIMVPEDKIYIIPNGIYEEIFRPIHRDEAVKKLQKTFNIDLETYDYMLLYYGSIDLWIDFDLILKAMKRIRQNLGKPVLLLVGKSHNPATPRYITQKMKEYNITNVKIMKPVPQKSIPLFINASHTVLAPVKREIKNAGPVLKVIESLACGTPVILTYMPEYRIWFGNAPIYFIDNNDFLEKLILVLKNYETIHMKLLEISLDICKKFSWNNISNIYNNLIISLLSK